VRVCFIHARACTPSSPERKREREKEIEKEAGKERERKKERVFILKRNDGCLGTL